MPMILSPKFFIGLRRCIIYTRFILQLNKL
jgi:hypothetical protein